MKIPVRESVSQPLGVVGRIMAPKDTRILISPATGYVPLEGNRDCAALIKLEMMRLS